MRTGAALERLWQETRHATRRLRRSPAFALATVLTLALAIGANAAIFAVVYRVVLNPLPYGASNRLVALEFSIPIRNLATVYYILFRLYFQYLERAHTLDGLALYVATNELTLTGQGNPERIRVSRTSSSLASVLRVTPAIGRWFNESEMAPGASPAAVLSHGLWVRRFETVEELRLALIAFKRTYNQGWIIERHGYKTPAQVRADQVGQLPMAA